MFDSQKNKAGVYATVDNIALSGADFEKKWFESAIMILNRVKSGFYPTMEAQTMLIKVCDGLQWIQENLNEKLVSQHRTLLKNIYSVNIQILNGAIQTKNMELLDIVISTLETITQPYYRNQK
jgi:hypothetical protein